MPGMRSPYVLMYDLCNVVHWARAYTEGDPKTKYYAQPCGTGARCLPNVYGPEPRWVTCLWCSTFTTPLKS